MCAASASLASEAKAHCGSEAVGGTVALYGIQEHEQWCVEKSTVWARTNPLPGGRKGCGTDAGGRMILPTPL